MAWPLGAIGIADGAAGGAVDAGIGRMGERRRSPRTEDGITPGGGGAGGSCSDRCVPTCDCVLGTLTCENECWGAWNCSRVA